MSVDDWFPEIEWSFDVSFPWRNGVDEDFQMVYEAYENFYREANTRNGRAGKRMSAGQDFMDAVIAYYDVNDEEATAGVGMGLFLGSEDEYEPGPLDEKMEEEELFQYLNGNL